jgi:hypothetical protein
MVWILDIYFGFLPRLGRFRDDISYLPRVAMLFW